MQELICSWSDIIPSDKSACIESSQTDCDVLENGNQIIEELEMYSQPNYHAIFQTVSALIQFYRARPTNTKINMEHEIESYDQYFKECGIHFQKINVKQQYKTIGNADDGTVRNQLVNIQNRFEQIECPKTLDLKSTTTTTTTMSETTDPCIKNNNLINIKLNYNKSFAVKFNNENYHGLNGIEEECEYDSDIGKFNCKPSNMIEGQLNLNQINDLNLPTEKNVISDHVNIHSSEEDPINYKIVTKHIEFFETGSNQLQNNEFQENTNITNESKHNEFNDRPTVSTKFLITLFIGSLILLTILPSPK